MQFRIVHFLSVVALSLGAIPSKGSAQTSTTQSNTSAVVGASVSVTSGAGNSYQIQVTQPAAAPAVKLGEYDSAPWLDVKGGPQNTGRILFTSEIPGVAMSPEEKVSFQFTEKLYVVPPSGGTAAVGQVFVSFKRAHFIGMESQVLIPTGMLRVEQSGAAGEAAVAKIVKQFGTIGSDDALVPYASMGAPRTGTLTPVSNGQTASVAWVSDLRVLTGMQAYAILDAGSAAGVRMGDVFTMIRPRYQHVNGTWIPEKEIARARVVKVTERGSTVIIADLTEPAIKVGVTARLTARMP